MIYLHMGTMKTGTTVLQDFLPKNEDVLNERGFSYPLMTDLGIEKKYEHRNAHFLTYRPPIRDKKERAKRANEVREKGFEIVKERLDLGLNVILSDEILWYRQVDESTPGFWKRFLARMDEWGEDFRVIVYFRRQDDYLESYYKQCVKGNPQITDTFAEFYKGGKYRFIHVEYYSYLEKMAKIIGKDRIIVRPYEKSQFKNQNIYEDFLDALGLEWEDSFEIVEGYINNSFEGNMLEIKRIINHLPEYKNPDIYRRLMDELYENEGVLNKPKNKFTMFSSHGERMDFLDSLKEENEKVAREYLGRKDGILFREPVKEKPPYEIDSKNLYKDITMTLAFMGWKNHEKIGELEKEIKRLEKSLEEYGKILNKKNILKRGVNKIKKVVENG